MTQANAKPANALTIDVEDWYQSVYDVNAPLTDCFVRNTCAVLEVLAAHRVRATFFVLGLAAEKAPQLVKEIHAAGHEIQSHGYGHQRIHTQTPRQFRTDVLRSKNLLEDIIGKGVTGYRAPAFSIGRKTLWALDVLVETGFRFDSSIFPLRTRRYGIGGSPATPYRIQTLAGAEIAEFPVCSLQVGPLRLPAGGGGYLRLSPCALIGTAIRKMNRAGHPAVLYLHPYELAPDEWQRLPEPIPRTTRWLQGVGRGEVARKLHRLCEEFRFFPLSTLADCSKQRTIPRSALLLKRHSNIAREEVFPQHQPRWNEIGGMTA